MSELNQWLNALANAGLRDDFPPLMKGADYTLVWEVAEHPRLGDFTDGVFEMEVKEIVGLTAPVIATATVASGTVAGGVNPISISIPVSAQGSIVEPVASGAANLVTTIIYTPAGGVPTLVRGGLVPVLAGVTS